MTSPPHIIVLGAGVIGLQTAIVLLESGLQVSIVAKHWPGDMHLDYASPSASAQWRPAGHPEDDFVQEWSRETFEHWLDHVSSAPSERSGIELKDAMLLWENLTDEAEKPYEKIWWSSLVPGFRVLTPTETPVGISKGIAYKSFAIAPTKYLRHLLAQCVHLGARQYKADVGSVMDVFAIPDIPPAVGVVNCAGLSALQIAQDPAVFPTKGQTIAVRGESRGIVIKVGGPWEAWVVPHPGTASSLIGGCKLPNDWSETADDEITAWILKTCASLAPELLNSASEFDVLSIHVGRRPSRHGGPRLELEWISPQGENGQGKFLCHNYGHSHCGYETSVGAARKATQLVRQALQQSGNLT